MASRAKAVSIASLTKAIDAGVKLAARRHGVKLGGETIIRDWCLSALSTGGDHDSSG